MKDELTLSHINLHAILRNLENLCALDEQAMRLCGNKKISIGFFVKNGPKARLGFSAEGCRYDRDITKASILLYFKSPAHFNGMIDGKANPIPLKGLRHLGFLTGNFTVLTDLLASYLKPTTESISNAEFRDKSAILTLYTAAYALGEIAMKDPQLKKLAADMPEGDVALVIGTDSPDQSSAKEIGITLRRIGSNFQVENRLSRSPRAIMRFRDPQAAFDLLNGIVDSYSSIALESLVLSGYIPMLDIVDRLLFRVNHYFKED